MYLVHLLLVITWSMESVQASSHDLVVKAEDL